MANTALAKIDYRSPIHSNADSKEPWDLDDAAWFAGADRFTSTEWLTDAELLTDAEWFDKYPPRGFYRLRNTPQRNNRR
jgi:hypothetical protein